MGIWKHRIQAFELCAPDRKHYFPEQVGDTLQHYFKSIRIMLFVSLNKDEIYLMNSCIPRMITLWNGCVSHVLQVV